MTDAADTARRAAAGPRIGTDEWVERHDERLEETRFGRGRRPRARRARGSPRSSRSPRSLPLLTSSQYVVRVGVDTLIFALLALGLNVVVGWAGLLDLGYVAFFGFGAYFYAILSSDQFDLHWPAEVTVPSSSRAARSSASSSGCRRGGCSATTWRS